MVNKLVQTRLTALAYLLPRKTQSVRAGQYYNATTIPFKDVKVSNDSPLNGLNRTHGSLKTSVMLSLYCFYKICTIYQNYDNGNDDD